MGDTYGAAARAWQDRFDTRRLADRLNDRFRSTWTLEDIRSFVEAAPMFFLATADAEGRPQCSYKGGAPGFVRVLGEMELCFPNYDGNGMYLSMGNLMENPHVGLLFIDFADPNRARVSGRASVDLDDPADGDLSGRPVRRARRRRRGVPELPALHPSAGPPSSHRRSCPPPTARRPCPTGNGRTGRATCSRRTIRPVAELSRRSFLALGASIAVGACSSDERSTTTDSTSGPSTALTGTSTTSTTTTPTTSTTTDASSASAPARQPFHARRVGR